MRRRILFAVIVLLFIVPIFAGCASSDGSQTNVTTGREVAPDFSWQTLDGEIVHLSDLKGKVVLLDFWATWCGPCRSTIPHVEAIHNNYKDSGVIVIGVNMDTASKRQAVAKFIKENEMTYFVISDANGNVASLYGVTSIPRFFLVDKSGDIASTKIGNIPDLEELITSEIDKLLEE
jgi:thiol-disulfide isomerase/thioredoxin